MEWIPVAISTLALTLSGATFIGNRRKDTQAVVRTVSVSQPRFSGLVSEGSHSTAVLRNDSVSPINVKMFGFAYGDTYIEDRNKMVQWAFQSIDYPGIVPAGEQVVIPVPISPTNTGLVGPVAIFIDPLGQTWRVTGARFTRLSRRSAIAWQPLARLCDRSRRFQRFDQWIEVKQLTKRMARPGALPVVPFLVERLWGWRVGMRDTSALPPGAPRGWKYASDTPAQVPPISSTPQYYWKSAGDE